MKCIACNSDFSITSADTTAAMTSIINTNCASVGCGYNMTKVIYNKIRFKIKQEEEKYYNNRRRCACTKTYELTNIVPCCDLERNAPAKKSQANFNLHNLLYLTKDLCEIAVGQLHQAIRKDGSRPLEN